MTLLLIFKYLETYFLWWGAGVVIQQVHSLEIRVEYSGLYYKCLMIVIYDRNDMASTIKLQLWS